MYRLLVNLLSVLLLTSFTLAEIQSCGDTTYTAYDSELADGQSIRKKNELIRAQSIFAQF